jgi:hypothetical protein
LEIIGSVEPEAVPQGARRLDFKGVWSTLARRAMMDHEQGRVTVIKLNDMDEYKKMRNGVQTYFSTRRYRLNPVIVEQADGLRVFMELQPSGPEPLPTPTPAPQQHGGTPLANHRDRPPEPQRQGPKPARRRTSA